MYRLFTPDVGGKAGFYTDWFIMILISLNVAAFILETVAVVKVYFGPFFVWFEIFSVGIFTVEYLGRLWSSVEAPDVEWRVRYAMRFMMVVDFLAIFPAYLVFLGIPADLRFLRAFRLLRLLRLLKIARYSKSMQAFRLVSLDKKPDLVVASFANVIILIIASSIVFHFEHPVQPEVFTSIPATFWWGIATLTTVGYGDVTPITPMGQLFGGMTAILGIGLFALPASILAAGFIEEAGSVETSCPHCGQSIRGGL